MIPRLEIHFSWALIRAFLFGKEYSPEDNEFCFNHARSGILFALQSLRLPLGSGVGVMAYNCHTVFNAISQAGYKPVFLDVTERMILDRKDLRIKSERISALVVTHLFGILNDVASIQAEYPGLPIIEDCAHAYGINRINGDFAVFSIGQGKLPSLGDGGIMLVSNNTYKPEIKRLYDKLTEYDSLLSAKLFFSLLLKSLSHRRFIYTLITEPLKRNCQTHSGKEQIVPRKICKGVSAMYNESKASVPKDIMRRAETAKTLSSSLSTLPGVRNVFYGDNVFMILAYCDDVGIVKNRLRDTGIETATHFAHCLDWASEFGYVHGECPKTEDLIHHLLMIPAYFTR